MSDAIALTAMGKIQTAMFFGLVLITTPVMADSLQDECDRWHQASGGYGTGCPGGPPITPELQRQFDEGGIQVLVHLCEKYSPQEDLQTCVGQSLLRIRGLQSR